MGALEERNLGCSWVQLFFYCSPLWGKGEPIILTNYFSIFSSEGGGDAFCGEPAFTSIRWKTWSVKDNLSHEKHPTTFHYTGWLIGILDPYNGLFQSPYNCIIFHPLYTPNNQGFFHCSLRFLPVLGNNSSQEWFEHNSVRTYLRNGQELHSLKLT